jgi:hypothetical protein
MAEKLYAPGELNLARALQLLAVLIDRLGGEVLIERRAFEMMEDVPVVGRDYGTHVVLHLGGEDCEEFEVLPPDTIFPSV